MRQPLKFSHSETAFHLEGRHRNLACRSCHVSLQFNAARSQCLSCHTDVHQGKLSPDCATCHTAENWIHLNAETAHANTTFPIIGAHARLDCQACHTSEVEGEYSMLSSDCITCHRADYQNASEPAHSELGFGPRCESCHNFTAWRPASFGNHDPFFPITSGKHRGEWDACTDCHFAAGDFSQFTCFNCHEHSQSRMDDKHREVSGYSYESSACYACHPRGSGDD